MMTRLNWLMTTRNTTPPDCAACRDCRTGAPATATGDDEVEKPMDAGSREKDDDGSARDNRRGTSRRQQSPESGAAEAAGTRHRRSQARPAGLEDPHQSRGQRPGQRRQSQSRSQILRALHQRWIRGRHRRHHWEEMWTRTIAMAQL